MTRPALILLALATIALHLAAPTNHDVAVIIDGANRLIEGGQFGRDVIDVNPPLAWWLTAVPVAFARILGSGAAETFMVVTTLLILASIATANAALCQGNLVPQARAYAMIVAGAILLIAPGYDYGQREHLMLITSLPYLSVVSIRGDGARISWPIATTAGLMSAVGFCLKPYFLLIPFLVELWLIFKLRGILRCIRAETVVIPAVALWYIWAVLIFAPDYLFSVVPEAAAGYWAYNGPFLSVVSRSVLALLPSIIVAWILHRSLSTISSFAQVMFVASTGAFFAALVQVKGWSYHLLPATSFAGIGCAVIYDAVCRTRQRQMLATIALLLLFAANFGDAVRYGLEVASGRGTVDRVKRLTAVFANYAGKGGVVFGFITSPRDVFPAVVASGAQWATSTSSVYLLPASVRAGEVAPERAVQVRSAAKRQISGVISEISMKRPAVVVVDANRSKLGFGNLQFDYLTYLAEDPSFAAFWSAYSEHDPVDGFRIFIRLPHDGGLR